MIIGIIKSVFYMLSFYFLIKLFSYIFKFIIFLKNKKLNKNNNEINENKTLKMLQCENCKIYVVKSEAYICNGKIFCKKEHVL